MPVEQSVSLSDAEIVAAALRAALRAVASADREGRLGELWQQLVVRKEHLRDLILSLV
jgi:hypothetical protein